MKRLIVGLILVMLLVPVSCAAPPPMPAPTPVPMPAPPQSAPLIGQVEILDITITGYHSTHDTEGKYDPDRVEATLNWETNNPYYYYFEVRPVDFDYPSNSGGYEKFDVSTPLQEQVKYSWPIALKSGKLHLYILTFWDKEKNYITKSDTFWAPVVPKAPPPPAPAPVPAPSPAPAPSPLERIKVHFIDVGQGDSILIDLGDIELLIDGGGKSPGVVSYLKSHIDGALEVMVATHPHADHIGGLIDVLAAFEVKEIWHNGDTSTSKTYSEFMSAVNSENAQVNKATRGDIINVDSLNFNVLHPADLSDTTNNNSIMLYLGYGDIDFLFTGDAEKEAEAAMLLAADIPVPSLEILKVGHHGSKTASSQDFLVATSPEIAIYMAGEGNSYGHPHDETIIALSEAEADIYGTDVHGTIVITTDGRTYELQLEKPGPSLEPSVSTIEPAPKPPAQLPPTTPINTNIEITRIFYDGQVYRVESDEYVKITNLGDEPQNLAGWILRDIDEGYPSFTFPSYILEPGESIRVYTNEIHPEYGGFSFGFGKAVWNNRSPDTAALYDDQGREVSRKSY